MKPIFAFLSELERTVAENIVIGNELTGSIIKKIVKESQWKANNSAKIGKGAKNDRSKHMALVLVFSIKQSFQYILLIIPPQFSLLYSSITVCLKNYYNDQSISLL